MDATRCHECGQELPTWDDLPAAIEEVLKAPDIPHGLRPMLMQAMTEIRMLYELGRQHGFVRKSR
jgi:hypothetical protein